MKTWRRWTPDDDRKLRNWWGIETMRTIAGRLGRTGDAVAARARILGLAVVPTGPVEYLTHAARRTGFHVESLRRILERAGVPMDRTMSRPLRAKTKRRCRVVDRALVDAAVEDVCRGDWFRTVRGERT